MNIGESEKYANCKNAPTITEQEQGTTYVWNSCNYFSSDTKKIMLDTSNRSITINVFFHYKMFPFLQGKIVNETSSFHARFCFLLCL